MAGERWKTSAAQEAPGARWRSESRSAGGDSLGAAAALGAGAAGAAGLAALAKTGKLGAALKTANALRQQAMLTAWAGPKSMLGNIGSGVEAAIEGKGLGALKEILSRRTVSDAIGNFKRGSGVGQPGLGHAVELPKILSFPGRAMGAIDEATQAALRRSGMSAEEATSAVLQKPLDGRLGKVVESPMAQYLHPFRRTPFNSWLEGLDKYGMAANGDKGARRGLAVYSAAGAAHGAATADDERPMSIPMAIAASSRYGLPYGVAAIAGRHLAGGKMTASGIAGNVLPVSEYGVETAMNPWNLPKTFKPAALTALERMTQ